MTEEKKKQLFPIFAYLFSAQMNPEKYGSLDSFESWSKLIQESPEDMNKISEEASKLTDEDWVGIEDQFNKLQETPAEAEVQFAKNGAKLNNLKRLQKHKSQKTVEPKKCSCGCTMIDKKEKGGKVVSTCSCGCSNKKEEGGSINNPKDTETKLNSATKVFKIYQKMKALKIK